MAPQRLAGEIAEDARRAQRLAEAFGAGLAFLAREQFADFGRTREQRLAGLVQHVAAQFGRCVRPTGLRLLGRRNGPRDVIVAAVGKARDDVVGVRGIAAFERFVCAGPLPVDVVAESLGIHGQS